MLFFFYHVDRPNSLDVRLGARQAHFDYIRSFNVVLGGPTLDDIDGHMDGSVILVDLPDRAAAEAFAANDPYVKAGLFAKSTIKAWRKTVPSPEV